MSAPHEFTRDSIAASTGDNELYTKLLKCGGPYTSLAKHGVHIGARLGFHHSPLTRDGEPRPGLNNSAGPGLDLGDESVYHNRSGAAAAYWESHDLPRPTKDIRQLRADLKDWGYCLIHEGLSAEQLARMQRRTSEQAEGERLAGVASWASGGNQFIHAILNKDPENQFAQCMCHDPLGVQAGPVIEQLIAETIGQDFIGSSFLGIIAHKHGMPQDLHMDQGIKHLGGVQEAPYTVNTMYLLDDFCARNGGTLLVPGSHRLIAEAGAGNPVPEPFPPAISLSAPAGTVVLFEGRLLHGTGVNRTDVPRRMFVANSLKPQLRAQELWALSLHPEVLESASPKLLYRLGLRPTGLGGIEGDWDLSKHGLRAWRQAIDRGEYLRIGVLSPDSTEEELSRPYTWRQTPLGQKMGRRQPQAIEAVRRRYIEPEAKL